MRDIVEEDWLVKPKQLIIEKWLDWGNKINYQLANRLCQTLRTEIFRNAILSFQKMPSLISKMKSSAYAGYEVVKHSLFHRAWVLPKCSENLVGYLRYFRVMDGAHCTTRHYLVPLVIKCSGRNKKVLVYAWALVPQEDHENWCWFLKITALYLTFFNDPDTVIISNWWKGIASTVIKSFSFTMHCYCSKHLYNNVRHNYGEMVAQKFWGYAYAKTESVFDKVFSKIWKLGDKTAEYISRLSQEQSVSYTVTSTRYGHITSNIQESKNFAWLPVWNLPALNIMLSIWKNLRKKYYECQCKRQPISHLTNFV